MVNRFARASREVIVDARAEARAAGSPTLEAEHVLLALSGREGNVARQILASAGLDHGRIQEAIQLEFAGSLRAAGVTVDDFDLPPASIDPVRTPRWSESSKLVIRRAKRICVTRRDSHLEPMHLLLGVLDAKVGTVPRALALAGVDRAELARRAARALS